MQGGRDDVRILTGGRNSGGKVPHVTCVHCYKCVCVHIPVNLCVFSCLCANVCLCICMHACRNYMHSWVKKCGHLDHVFVYILHVFIFAHMHKFKCAQGCIYVCICVHFCFHVGIFAHEPSFMHMTYLFTCLHRCQCMN